MTANNGHNKKAHKPAGIPDALWQHRELLARLGLEEIDAIVNRVASNRPLYLIAKEHHHASSTVAAAVRCAIGVHVAGECCREFRDHPLFARTEIATKYHAARRDMIARVINEVENRPAPEHLKTRAHVEYETMLGHPLTLAEFRRLAAYTLSEE